MKKCIDFIRYYGTDTISNKEFKKKPLEVQWLYYYRILHNRENSKYTYKYYLRKFNKIKRMTHISIGYNTEIGEGFYIGHTGRVIINGAAQLGKNVNIATGVTIGQENRGQRKGCPIIGNSVWIGTNAVIVGKITIGDDVLIAPLSFVNFDVPSHSIVIGNPAKIIPSKNATIDYINNVVL